MPRYGPMTPEHRAKNSASNKRTYEKRAQGKAVSPRFLTKFLATKQCPRELRLIAGERLELLGQMIRDLGGESEVSAMQIAILQGWFYAQVSADVYFINQNPDAASRFLSTASRALQALGLHKRAKRSTLPAHELIARDNSAEPSNVVALSPAGGDTA